MNIMRLTMLSGVIRTSVGFVVRGTPVVMAGACTPGVEVAEPEKPITIDLNVKIDREIRVKVDKELDQVLSNESGLF